MRVLVVGAGGVLAAAADALAARGDEVSGVARSEGRGMIAVDARDAFALSHSLGNGEWDAAIVYGPAVSAMSERVIREAVSGAVVVVLTTEAGAPGRPDPTTRSNVLLLGWTADDDSTRWHTAQEISTAAIEVLDSGESRLLGSIRPWSERPR